MLSWRLAVSALIGLSLAIAATADDAPLVGKAAPAFELPALGGDRIALADLRGEIVVLHFGTGW